MAAPFWSDQLARGLEAMGVPLEAETRRRLLAYLDLLYRWNRAYNLTAVRDPRQAVPRQLLDSLSILPLLTGRRILDLGSGGGLPGVPLALARPELSFVLLDSGLKKVRFLRQVKLTLGLDNVAVVQARAESYHPSAPFDLIVSRAFAPLDRMVAVSRHLLAPEGAWLAMKGKAPQAELAALGAGWRARVVPLEVPGETGARHAVRLQRA